MSSPYLEPNSPAADPPLVSGEVRGQFQGIQSRFDAAAQVQQLGLTVSNPPTQGEMQAIADKLDEVITRLQGS